MKLYLSSYKIGNESDRLKRFVSKGRIGYLANALDFTGADKERRARHIQGDMESLEVLGLDVQTIDLRDYFGKADALRGKLDELAAIFVSGGDVFVLRQAMRLSGLDTLLQELRASDAFLYAGYSAAGCVLAPSLKSYEIVDPPETPYPEQTEVIWDGLALVDFAFMPHWKSDHPESSSIDREIAYCERYDIPYRAIRDGEVIFVEQA
jgi:dipeptidase E